MLSRIKPLLVVAGSALVLCTAPLWAQNDASAPAAAKPSYPDAKVLLQKSVDAVGGADARLKRKSMELRGSIEMAAQNLKGPMVSRFMQPNLMTVSFEIPGIEEVRSGYDGTTGWATSKLMGPRLMTDKEREAIAREADFMKDVDPARRFDTVETVGEGRCGAFECWKVIGTKAGDKTVIWIEKSTSLPRGYSMSMDTVNGRIEVSSVLTEYKDFEGIKLPVRTESTQAGAKLVITVDSVVFDGLAAANFELPPAVKALLEPEPPEADSDAPKAGKDGTDGAKGETKPSIPAQPKP